MRNFTVPPNWAQLVKNSSELVTTEQYDLSKTWFEGQDDPSADTMLQTPAAPDAITALKDSNDRSQASSISNEGVVDQNNTANEGDNSTIPTPPVLTTVPEGEDALGMPEIMNFQESGLRRLPRIATKRIILATVFFLE